MPHSNEGRGHRGDKTKIEVRLFSDRQFAQLIKSLAGVAKQLGSIASNCASKSDLTNTEKRIAMKLSQVKQIVATTAGQNKEAFKEIGTKIDGLETRIQELIDQQNDPDVTDETFLANLQQLQTDAQALSDIVPGTPPAESTDVET